MSNLSSCVEKLFDLSSRGSSIRQEVYAGIISFISVSYILLLNPYLITSAATQLDPLLEKNIIHNSITTATAVSSGVITILYGLLVNQPIILTPGIGITAYAVYGLIIPKILSMELVYSLFLLSGIFLVFFGLLRGYSLIHYIIPHCIKLSCIAGIGLFLSLLGFHIIGLVTINPQTQLLGIGEITSNYILGLLGLFIIVIGMYYKLRGATLLGIVIITLLHCLIDQTYPTQFLSLPSFSLQHFAFNDLLSHIHSILLPLFAILLVVILDAMGMLFALQQLNPYENHNNNKYMTVESGSYILLGFGCILSALLGSSPLVLSVESLVAIKEHGRTGLTAVVAGLLLCGSVFLSPLLQSIPSMAIAPVLLLIGAIMLAEIVAIDWRNLFQAIPSFLTLTLIPFTFDIGNGIMMGLLSYLILSIATGNIWSIHASNSNNNNNIDYGGYEPIAENEVNSAPNSNRANHLSSLDYDEKHDNHNKA
jgi:AGZA family xanthine/uracil permease-like MFS transporter